MVRTDLKMGKGKTAVQVAHAAVLTSEKARQMHKQWYSGWIVNGQAKIAVKIGSEEELLALRREAEGKGLPVALVEDRGLTQLEPGTRTCLGIGPAPAAILDRLTGSLKLL